MNIQSNQKLATDSGTPPLLPNRTELEAFINSTVEKLLAIYDADKIGKVDYALASSGGSVLSVRCTETFSKKNAQYYMWGYPLWSKAANDPRIALEGLSCNRILRNKLKTCDAIEKRSCKIATKVPFFVVTYLLPGRNKSQSILCLVYEPLPRHPVFRQIHRPSTPGHIFDHLIAPSYLWPTQRAPSCRYRLNINPQPPLSLMKDFSISALQFSWTQPAINPGECWAFTGSRGYLVIELSENITVTAFTLEHLPRSLSPTGNIDTAPKEFHVLGLESEQDDTPILLGQFKYEDNGVSLQHFQALEVDYAFKIVELVIESNHGNLDYTCLYRFRVHGRPARLSCK
ncbi:Secreted beta-glucosidase sun1 [Homalodisca vitripennis]|nr:Secreted beta-glucosidase sun1 [Homalodisca vitripennis]